MLKRFKSQILNVLSLNSERRWNYKIVKMQTQETIIHFNIMTLKNYIL